MRKHILLFAIVALSLSSCDRNMVYDSFYHIENELWHWDDKAEFTFEIDDTLSLHDVYIQLRHTTEYPMSNLYMFVHVEGPGGQQISDTIQFIIAEANGKWKGKGSSKIKELKYLYRSNTRFAGKGAYALTLEQAMRQAEIPVKEIGLRIEKK